MYQEHVLLDELTAENNEVFIRQCCPEACGPTTTDIISQHCLSIPGQKHELRNGKRRKDAVLYSLTLPLLHFLQTPPTHHYQKTITKHHA
ncbi:uncharacterized [Tachysurus ichikawai]